LEELRIEPADVELAIGQGDTMLDRVLWRLEQGMDREAIAGDVPLSPAQIRYVQTLTERARRLLAPPLTPPTAGYSAHQRESPQKGP
jgi:hypothetical protein